MPSAVQGKHGKWALVALLYVLILIGGGWFGALVTKGFDIAIWPHTEPMINKIIVLGILFYILLTALPFVPGVELGLALIVAFGVQIVPVVYLATLAALLFSFLVGRLVPETWLVRAFAWLGFGRASSLISAMSNLDSQQRVDHLLAKAPKRFLPWIIKNRLLALCVLFNMPGSALLGGGGGVAMAAGISRLLSFPKFLLTAAIAVSPVPILLIGNAWVHRG
jgi:hypothetical protein